MFLQSIGVALILFMPLWAPLVTLRGIALKVTRPNESTHYNLADGMILIALISIATALAANAPIDRYTQNWILIVSLNLLLVLMWYKSVTFMQRYGIKDNASRIAIQIFVYPSATFALSLFLICSLVVVLGVIASLISDYNEQIERVIYANLILLIVSCGWIYLTRKSFLAILNRNRP